MSTQPQSDGRKYSFDLTALDGESRDVLRAIAENDGGATTKFIRRQAAVERGQAHYRLEKLEDLGLISTYNAVPENGGQEVTHAELTDTGREAINAGLLEDITDANTSLRQLRQDLQDVEKAVSRKAGESKMHRRLDELRAEIEDARQAADRADTREDLEAIHGRLEDLEVTADRLDSAIADVEDAATAARREAGERATEERVNRSVDALNKRIEATRAQAGEDVADAAATLHERIDDLAERVDELPETEDVAEVRRKLVALREDLEQQDVTEAVASIEAAMPRRGDALASKAYADALDERLSEVEQLAENNATTVRENNRLLTRGKSELPYPELSKGKKREYWLDLAQQEAEERGCEHADGDWGERTLLAHLDHNELAHLESEELFNDRTIQRAKLADPDGYWRRWLKLLKWALIVGAFLFFIVAITP